MANKKLQAFLLWRGGPLPTLEEKEGGLTYNLRHLQKRGTSLYFYRRAGPQSGEKRAFGIRRPISS